jgi:hypothetical protein
MGSKTDQQKIEDHWKATKDITIHQNDLKKLASKSSQELYSVCRQVDEDRVSVSRNNPELLGFLNAFIDYSTEEQVQKMFDIMIVQWEWRTRMLQAWDVH